MNHSILTTFCFTFIQLSQPNYSALHHAVMFGTKKEVQELVKLGAFPERAEDGKS